MVPPVMGSGHGRGGSSAGAPPAASSATAAILRNQQNANRASNQETIELTTNFIELKTNTDFQIHDYRVDFEPSLDNERVRKGMVYSLKPKLGPIFYDGNHNLKAVRRLEEEISQPINMPHAKTQEIFKIKITLTGSIERGSPEESRLFNIIQNNNMDQLGLLRIKRNYYDWQKPKTMPHEVQGYPGYRARVINTVAAGAMLKVDASMRVVQPGTVLERMKTIRGSAGPDWVNVLRAEISGQLVMTKYNRKLYRIEDVVLTENPTYKFKDKTGQEITMIDYYQTRYNLEVVKDQPLLHARSLKDTKGSIIEDSQKLYLVPELCVFTGIPDSLRDNVGAMRSIIAAARLNPADRLNVIANLGRRLATTEKIKQEMSAFGIEYGDRLVTVAGRRVRQSEILLGREVTIDTSGGSGQFAINRNQLWAVKNPDRPIPMVIIFSDTMNPNSIQDFRDRLISEMRSQGRVIDARPLKITGRSPTSYTQAFNQVQTDSNLARAEILLVLVDQDFSPVYEPAKKMFTTANAVRPMVTQFANIRKFNKQSVIQKLAMQIHTKIGSIPWIKNDLPRGMLILGVAIVPHGTLGGKSVLGLVASTNGTYSQWNSKAAIVNTNDWEAVSDQLAIYLSDRLANFLTHNSGKHPRNIFIYRAGIPEGEVPLVRSLDLTHIRRRLVPLRLTLPHNTDGGDSDTESDIHQEEQSEFEKIRLTYLLVNKHSTARFFVKNGHGVSNVPPSTAVDSVITEKNEFYINSHANTQGTARPTQYLMLFDNSGVTVQQQISFANNLTEFYFNWSGQIRIPAPVMYATKLATMVADIIRDEPHPALADTLFYL